MAGTEIPRFDPAALTAARHACRLRQVDLARRLHTHEDAVHRWERGKTPISAADLRRVAHVLRVTPAHLQHPLPPHPTLADLRTQQALTQGMAALRLGIKPHRLALWERGVLHNAGEHGAVLAAHVAVSVEQITAYEHHGTLPPTLALRLAKVLHVDPSAAHTAFLHSRRDRGNRKEAS